MAGDDEVRAALLRRLDLGEAVREAWLTVAEVAALAETSRFSVDRWLRGGVKIEDRRMVIRYKSRPDGRVCHPGDVLAVLAEFERIRSVDDMPPGPEREAAMEDLRRRNRGETGQPSG